MMMMNEGMNGKENFINVHQHHIHAHKQWNIHTHTHTQKLY